MLRSCDDTSLSREMFSIVLVSFYKQAAHKILYRSPGALFMERIYI